MTAGDGPITIDVVPAHADEPAAAHHPPAADHPAPATEPGPATDERPVFYFDLGSPACYLTAERIMATLPVVPEWEPVLGTYLGLSEPAPEYDWLDAAVTDQGLQRLRMPVNWPPDSELAMLAAVYAKGGGKTVSYSLAAFRQAFAGGRDLGDEGTVLIAAAACEMHPRAVLKGVALRSTRAALRRACARAEAADVTALPAIATGSGTYCGARALELATDALAV
jgi:2-hydroxychromene-2-carboxylate isomerase